MKTPTARTSQPTPTLVVGDLAQCPAEFLPPQPAACLPLNDPTAVRAALTVHHVEQLLLVPAPRTRFEEISPILSDATNLAIPTHIPLCSDGEHPRLVILHSGPHPVQLACKRGIDLTLAAVLLLLLLPLLALIALLIKLDSRGPVLFCQTRVGKHNQPFRLLKFRSMVNNAEQLKPSLAHLNEQQGPLFKIRQDPRVTRLGRWLRKSSLDELPQLWNVLRGDMSLVGPRPPLADEVDHYLWHHRKRLAVKPGLTCIWQISGRSNIPFEQGMQMDHAYIHHWSLLLDLKILLLTIPAVLLGRGAS